MTRPHGVRGELRVLPHTDEPERFAQLERVFVGDDPPVPYSIESARLHQGIVIVKLAGCEDRNQADEFRGQWLQIPIEEALPLQEGEFYLFQLVGLQVRTAAGELLGEIREILQTGANDVFIVQQPGAAPDLLVPDSPGVVLEINPSAGQMTVELPPGLRDE